MIDFLYASVCVHFIDIYHHHVFYFIYDTYNFVIEKPLHNHSRRQHSFSLIWIVYVHFHVYEYTI